MHRCCSLRFLYVGSYVSMHGHPVGERKLLCQFVDQYDTYFEGVLGSAVA
jgi:hypothetical protein